MRRAKLVLVLVGLVAFSMGGCRRGMCAQPVRPLVWTALPADAVEVTELEHVVRFEVPLPAQTARAGRTRRIELRFSRPLDSAKVETFGSGPRRLMIKVQERVRGEALAVDLPPLEFERVAVIVHHHLRPVPLPPEVRIGQEVRR